MLYSSAFAMCRDPGMVSFSDAIASGAMAELEALHLSNNRIGDAGMTAFAGAT